MDFNKLVNTLKSIDPTNVFDPNGASKKALTESAAPAQKIELSDEAQLRVLAGVSTVLAESKVVAEKAVSVAQQQAAGAALAAKRGEGKAKGASKEMSKMSTKELEKFAGTKHKGLPKKVGEAAKVLDDEEELDEVFDADAKVGDKKKTSTGVATKTATGLKHEKTYGKDADTTDDADEKPAKKKVKEGKKPDFLDVDKDGNKKEPMKKAVADKKKGAVKKESEMMPKGKKRPVKESIEPRLSFKECIKLVKESGGQQQIDPVDKVLWQWVERVAATKYPMEGVQRDAFAGVTYERFGGRFELFDILSETKK